MGSDFIASLPIARFHGVGPLFGDLLLQSAPDSTGFTNTKQDIHVG